MRCTHDNPIKHENIEKELLQNRRKSEREIIKISQGLTQIYFDIIQRHGDVFFIVNSITNSDQQVFPFQPSHAFNFNLNKQAGFNSH